MSGSEEKAILAGGCFWGMQDLIRKRPGVISTRVGYTGGDVPNATYRNHGTHAEAIEIIFDPEQTSYRDLLEFFFQIHDPTTQEPPGQRRRRQLPLGDLLHRRRAAHGRRGHDRRRRRLRAVARQGGHRGRRRPGRSGRPSPSTRTTSSATPTATRATSSGRTGCCPGARSKPPASSESVRGRHPFFEAPGDELGTLVCAAAVQNLRGLRDRPGGRCRMCGSSKRRRGQDSVVKCPVARSGVSS